VNPDEYLIFQAHVGSRASNRSSASDWQQRNPHVRGRMESADPGTSTRNVPFDCKIVAVMPPANDEVLTLGSAGPAESQQQLQQRTGVPTRLDKFEWPRTASSWRAFRRCRLAGDGGITAQCGRSSCAGWHLEAIDAELNQQEDGLIGASGEQVAGPRGDRRSTDRPVLRMVTLLVTNRTTPTGKRFLKRLPG